MGLTADTRRRLIVGEVPHDFDARSDIVLGPWSFIGKEEAFPGWESLPFEPDPFSTTEELAQAAKLTTDYANAMFPKLVTKLNQWNGADRSEEFWRVIVFPWLLVFVQTTYERQLRVNRVLMKYGEEQVSVDLLASDVTWAFEDVTDFTVRGIFDPTYNHWLFSRIFETKVPGAWQATYRSLPDLQQKRYPEAQRKRSPLRELAKTAIRRSRCSGINGVGHLQSLLFSLCLSLKPAREGETRKQRQIDSNSVAIDWNTDLGQLIESTLPLAYRANLYTVKEIAEGRKGKIRLIGPQMYWDESAKRRIARWAKAGETIICSQHGGNYGNAKVYPLVAEVEYRNYTFFSWGWTEQEDYSGRFVPLPSPLLSKFVGKYKPVDETAILVGTRAHLFSYRIEALPQALDQLVYRAEKVLFLRGLKYEIHGALQYRPYFDETGCLRDRDYFRAQFPGLRICSDKFHERLLRCKLLVLDHPGTTLNIALAANIPTICFWHDRAFPMCRQAQPYFDELRHLGLLFSSGAEAAAAVNAIWPNVMEWWRQDRVQEARHRWCSKYALASRSWWWQWAKAIWQY